MYDSCTQGKYINDPIHGHIHLPRYVVECMDTPQFQRLRDLRQMGTCYFVFPGASHNRFEHCIGTSHLAGELVERFQKEQPELEIRAEEVACMRLAGLCHDLGHGPFSHVFDNEFIPRARPGLHWEHEIASEMMFDHLIENNPVNSIDLSTDDCKLIKDLIAGRASPSRGFLYEIVNNKRNSVDVDKFDYIQRDCYNTGKKSSYDISRLMMFSRVIDDQICYDQKESYNLYELFRTRYSLFKQVYTHRGGKAIEYMLVDALLAADPYLKMSAMIDNPDEYLYLTDAILKEIERSKVLELAESRRIIKRIRQRDLYRFVDQTVLPSITSSSSFRGSTPASPSPDSFAPSTTDLAHVKSIITPANLVQFSKGLTEQDFIVEFLNINYAMKDMNPVDNVKFYSKYQPNEAHTIGKDQVSLLVPERYQETVIRVFTRQIENCKKAQDAFRTMLCYHGLAERSIKTDASTRIDVPETYYDVDVDIDQGSSFLTSDPLSFKPTTQINTSLYEKRKVASGSSSPTGYFGSPTMSSPTKMKTMPLNAHLTIPDDYASPRKKRAV